MGNHRLRRQTTKRSIDKAEQALATLPPVMEGKGTISITHWFTAAYIALFLIRPWETIFPWLEALHLERVWATMLIVIVLADRKSKFRLDSINTVLLLFGVSLGLGSVLSPNMWHSFDKFMEFAPVIVISLIIAAVLRNAYQVTFFISSHVAVMGVYLSKSLWEYFLHGHHRYRMGVSRLVGIETTFGGPNSLAMTIVATLPFAIFLWLNKTAFCSTWTERKRRLFSKGLVVYFTVSLFALFLTNSRSGVVGLVALLLLLWLRQGGISKKIKTIFCIFALLVVVWMAIPAQNRDRILTIWNPELGPKSAQTSAEGRIEGFYASWEMFTGNAFSGVGIGNFVPYRLEHLDGIKLEAHNLVGQTLGETGIIGTLSFSLYLLIVLGLCKKIRKTALLLEGDEQRLYLTLGYALRDVFILMFVLGLFGHNLTRYNWYWCGALVSSIVMALNLKLNAIKDEKRLARINRGKMGVKSKRSEP